MKKHLLFTACVTSSLFTFAEVPTSEREALIAIYNATDGSNWATTWDTTSAVSTWNGITVSNVDGLDHVTKIEISSSGMNGSMPPEIGNFPELTVLDFSFQEQLTGSIPAEIGNLTKLEKLIFWNNNLTGAIPSEIGNCTLLNTISFEDNSLTGNIPTSFANLTAMTSFWLNGNQMSGDIPEIFSNWPALQYFSIGDANLSGLYNNFSGVIDLSENSDLKYLWIDHNNISAVNIKNGNNSNMNNTYFNTTDNPNLSCVVVDDVSYSTSTWTQVGVSTSFVDDPANCSALGVDDLNFASGLQIYPNPARNTLHLSNTGESRLDRIVITNSVGQIVKITKATNRIDLTDFPGGIYQIRIENTEGKSANYKIVKL